MLGRGHPVDRRACRRRTKKLRYGQQSLLVSCSAPSPNCGFVRSLTSAVSSGQYAFLGIVLRCASFLNLCEGKSPTSPLPIKTQNSTIELTYVHVIPFQNYVLTEYALTENDSIGCSSSFFCCCVKFRFLIRSAGDHEQIPRCA